MLEEMQMGFLLVQAYFHVKYSVWNFESYQWMLSVEEWNVVAAHVLHDFKVKEKAGVIPISATLWQTTKDNDFP